MAGLDGQTRGVAGSGGYRWWLDVETANSREPNTQNNYADVGGMVAYFQGIGSTAAIMFPVRDACPEGA